MIFDGRNGGTVELLENGLVIRRKGVASFLTQGLKGEKRIPYSSIASVQFKEAGFTTGYIQFGIAGAIESRGGVWDATTDENTVLFTEEASSEFHRLRDIVEERAAAARVGGTRVSTSEGCSISEELTRLADLRDRGVLTDEEFAEQKSAVLGKSVRQTASTNVSPQAASSGKSQTQVPLPQSEPKRSRSGKILGFGCLGIIATFFVFSAIGSRIDLPTGRPVAPTDAAGATQARKALPASRSKSVVSIPRTAPLSQPVMIGLGGPNLDACGSNANVVGLDPQGDNFLSVKSAPRLEAPRIDKLGPGSELYVCDRSTDGKWLGVVYEPDGQTSANCGVTSAVPMPSPYSGRCQSGWVYSKYVNIYAG